MSFLINPYRFGAATAGNVSLLLHGDASPLVDSSGTPKTITAIGNAAYSTAQKKFGSGSIALDGIGDWLEVPSTVTPFGTGDFTIEAWIYRNNTNTAGIHDARSGPTTGPFCWYITSNKLSFFVTSNMLTTDTVPTLQWAHVAVTRSSGVLRQFINGIKSSEDTLTTNLTTANTNYIGRLRDGGTDFNGFLDEYRVTLGVARYTANFTPPTAPFPDS